MVVSSKSTTTIQTPKGSITGYVFNQTDLLYLTSMLKQIAILSSELQAYGGRALNVPEVISEGLCGYVFGAIRTSGPQSVRGDLREISTGQTLEVKSASNLGLDCTSFGPKSTWDQLIFVDFANGGTTNINGIVNFYLIDETKINLGNLVLNKKKQETFKMQQQQGRRPRFSVRKEIVQAYNLSPTKTLQLW